MPATNVLTPAVAPHPPAVERTGSGPAARLVGSVGALLGVWTLAQYLITVLIVRQYYREHLPHYDSIGSYGRLFELVNQVHREGFGAAALSASFNSITWLQPAYALLLAGLRSRRQSGWSGSISCCSCSLRRRS